MQSNIWLLSTSTAEIPVKMGMKRKRVHWQVDDWVKAGEARGGSETRQLGQERLEYIPVEVVDVSVHEQAAGIGALLQPM